MSREDDKLSSEDLVATAREQMASETGSSSAMVEAARLRFSDLASHEDQTKVGPDQRNVGVVDSSTDRHIEGSGADTPGHRQDARSSLSSGRRRAPSPPSQPMPAPPWQRDRTTPRRARRLIAAAALGLVVFSFLSSNFDAIRDFADEQLDESATSQGLEEEGTDASSEEVDSAGEIGGPEVDSVEFAVFPLPFGANPNGIEVGFDAVWYLDNHPNNKVGKLDLATGELLEQYSSPTPGLHGAIAIGFDAVWFAPERTGDEAGEVIFKLDPSDGSITSFELPINSGPSRMTTGLGYVWYTALSHNAVGRLDPVSGQVVEYPIPTAGSLAVGITTGFGAVWFTEVSETARKVGRLDPATGNITEYPMLTQTGFQCCGVTTGFDAVWYTASDGNVIGRLDPANGKIVEYPLPSPGSRPIEIVAGSDAVWFTELSGNRIGRLDPETGTITEYPVPPRGAGPFGIAEGGPWFSASGGGSIGRLDP